MSRHTQPDLQQMTAKFSNVAKKYGLQIGMAETEVMYQTCSGQTLRGADYHN